MSNGRRFYCSEADYLTERGVPLAIATQYQRCYGPAAIARMHQLGITPDQANAQPIDTALLFACPSDPASPAAS